MGYKTKPRGKLEKTVDMVTLSVVVITLTIVFIFSVPMMGG